MTESPEGQVLIDVAGVGYEAMCPVGTVSQAAHQGDDLILIIHTHVREDQLDLYGFASETGRHLFRLLLSTPGVGPKTALGIMSALPLETLAGAVGEGDIARLSKVPGIGKKTAERLVVELRGKLSRFESPDHATGPTDKTSRLLLALTNMGYRPVEAERAVRALDERIHTQSMSELLREALARLTP